MKGASKNNDLMFCREPAVADGSQCAPEYDIAADLVRMPLRDDRESRSRFFRTLPGPRRHRYE